MILRMKQFTRTGKKSMNIEQFVAQSIGEWRSMRSGHSLAFQQFEDVLSEISITSVQTDDQRLDAIIEASGLTIKEIDSPFQMEWNAESDWEPDDPNDVSSGSCIDPYGTNWTT